MATVDLGVPFDKLTATLQKCYDQHFLPIWGYPVKLYNTKAAKPTDWQFIYFDDADTAGALGYHDLTVKGQPVSKIFVKTTQQANEVVSVTACHELFEMVIDPIANLWAENSDGTEYAYEMCDPVEEDTFLVDGVEMSNFVHPAWFEPFKHPPGTKFDHLGLLKTPFTMTKGGYVILKRRARSREIRLRGQGKALRAGGSPRPSQRIPQAARPGHQAEPGSNASRAPGRLTASETGQRSFGSSTRAHACASWGLPWRTAGQAIRLKTCRSRRPQGHSCISEASGVLSIGVPALGLRTRPD